MSLEREASERHEAVALGLATFAKTYDFVATLLMLCDVLPLLARLSKIFQASFNFPFFFLDVSGSGKSRLLCPAPKHRWHTSITKKLQDSEGGQYLHTTDQVIDDLREQKIIIKTGDREKFMKQIFKKYLAKVIENIEQRFPDNHILKAFNVFNPADVDLQQYLELETLCDRFSIDFEGARVEYDVLINLMHQEYLTLTPSEMMQTITSRLGDIMPLMAKLAAVALVLPVSTAGRPNF
ncbi:uncharacterized protein LOC119726915 [Patiria miniata]|uniref:Uncharacterized protein n=1 Tax=Patiria miniata TaxID=46514 RepID=A0A913ZSF2_PATMI|nr:uncharacterized protein LOC119726915 [Patiria miniata]